MAEQTEETRITSIAELNDKVDALFSRLDSLGKPGTAKEKPEGDIDSQVQKALADAKSKEAEEAEKTSTKDRLKAIEEKLEKAPKQVSRLTRFMWGDD